MRQRERKSGERGGRTEEEALARAAVDEVLVRDAHDLHDARELLLLVLAGEDRVARVHLGEDAAERPDLRAMEEREHSVSDGAGEPEPSVSRKGTHVDGHRVVAAEDDLGRAVEARLDVGVDCEGVRATGSARLERQGGKGERRALLVLEAAAAEVDDLDAALGRVLEEDVLRDDEDDEVSECCCDDEGETAAREGGNAPRA